MNELDVKSSWLELHKQLSDEASAFHDSQAVAFGLLERYDSIPEHQRVQLHDVLREWLLSDDNSKRYDASFLISQRRIYGMRDAVKEAVEKCESQAGPESFYEAKKLRRILGELGAP